MVKFKKRN